MLLVVYFLLGCTAPSVSNGKVTVDGSEVAAGGSIANEKTFYLVCNTNYVVTPSQASSNGRTCSSGVISPTLTDSPYDCVLGLNFESIIQY